MLTPSFICIILTSIFRLQNHEINYHYMLGERMSKQVTEKAREWGSSGGGGSEQVSNGEGQGTSKVIGKCTSS